MTETLMSTGDVAKVLGVKPSTVSRWVREGKIEPVKLPSGRNRFRREAIAGMLPALADVTTD